MTNSTWSAVSLATLHDAARCLALFERDAIVALPDGSLTRAGWRLLHSHVLADHPPHAPRCEADVPVLSWLYRSLGAGGLIGLINGRVRLSQTAHDWLALPAPGQLQALRQIWLRMPEVAWAWLPQSSNFWARSRTRHELTRQLVSTVAALPVDTWVLITDLVADLAAQAEALEYGVARNLPSVRQALTHQAERLALCQLGELLPRLGLIRLEGVGAEACLAVLPAGAAWLRSVLKQGQIALTETPQVEQHANAGPGACWQVTADLRLIIPLAAPAAATFEALRFADLLALGPPSEYRITRASLEQALVHGYDLADLLFDLAHGADAPLPGPAGAQLALWREEADVIQCEPGYRLRPAGPARLAALRTREPFRAATEVAASGTWAFVGQPESAALFRYLRRSGYLLKLNDTVQREPVHPAPPHPEASAAPPWPALWRRRLPLIQLASLVGLYARLQARVPGLADLGVTEIEQTLLAALPVEARAAVARLVASHDALLTAHLNQTGNSVEAVTAPEAMRAASANPEPSADPPTLPGLTESLSSAIAENATLEILYADTQGAVTQRRVRPLRLEERWGRRYLVAHCELRDDERSFRLDRIIEIRRS